MYASRFFCFLSPVLSSRAFPGAVQHLLLLICLSRAGREDCSQQAGAMVPEALGALKMLPLALLPWKRSPSRQANASCQGLARGGDRWHFLLNVWA